jgi:hypothetical protein
MPRNTYRKGASVVNVIAPAETAPEPAPLAPEPVPPVPEVEQPAPVMVRPTPENQLTPEQRRIRDLENQLALERGRKDPEPELEPSVNPGDDNNILIHFVADGLTALGTVWCRGQELEFTPGSAAYRDTCDRGGRSWLDLRNNPTAQEQRWGEVKFRSGPWPGQDYTAAAKARFEALQPLKEGQQLQPTEDELAKAVAAEKRRGRAAPRLPLR